MVVSFSIVSVSWLNSRINKNPKVIKTKELLKASSHRANNLTQASCNPELEASYEQKGDFDNYSIGLSQTIDIWDKQSSNKAIGEIALF